jgi:amino acid adenylation domain-containing protein
MAQANIRDDADSFRSVLKELGHSTVYPAIQVGKSPNPVEVSYPQEQLWFLSQFEPARIAYNIPVAWKIAGSLDIGALELSLSEIVRRHESLRISFPLVGGKLMQYVSATDEFHLEIIDLRALPADQRQLECDRLMAEEARRNFNLSSGPLFHALLLRCADQEQVILLNVHHIVADGASVEALLAELEIGYSARTAGKTVELRVLPMQYRDYSVWERQCLQPDILEKYLSNWSRYLAGATPLDLTTDHPRPRVPSFQGRTVHYRLGRNLTEGLTALSRRGGVTLFMALSAAFQTLLHRYTSQDDVVVGFPITNRNRAEVCKLIGFFVNTVPLRIDFSGNPTFRELLKRVRVSMLQAYANRDLPFQKIVEQVDPERNTGRNPLFQVMIDQAQSSWLKLRLAGLTAEWIPIDNGTAKFDLSLHCVFGEEELTGWLEYSTDLYDAGTIERMLSHFQQLLVGIASDPDMRISTLPILTKRERQQLVVEWNQTNADYPSDACIPQLFESQVERIPESIAVDAEGKQLNYREVNCRANQLAWYLTKLGVGRETLVGVCRQHDWQTAVTLLGILKAGGAYVPLDPAYPQERLAFMAKDTGIQILVTEERWAVVFPQYAGKTICLERDWDVIAKEGESNLAVQIMPDDLAYVLYTSGSTGQPKGVMGLHRGAVNRFCWMWNEYPFEAGEIACLKTSLNFVDAVWEVFGPLLAGVKTVVIPEDAVRDSRRLVEILGESRVTRFVSVPSLLSALLDAEPDLGSRLPRLKHWVSSGEPLSLDLMRRFKISLPDSILINLYGSSEVSADVTCFDTRSTQDSELVLIGRPIANTQVYILDGEFQPVPIGQPGELWVGGAGLARGYWNAPEETQRKFISNPFTQTQEKLYRTGDRARYRPDGNIEYLGRVDHQVKIRGFRVEPGEIESLLAQHPQVKEAVVIPGEGSGDMGLVAYVVPEAVPAPLNGSIKLAPELRQFLRERVPDYMVPAVFVTLESLPLTSNGKIDRRALPASDGARPELQEAYVESASSLERTIQSIWREVLQIDRVGTHDNFFDIGGHSLRLAVVHSKLMQALSREMSIVEMFQYPTIHSLARHLGDEAPGPQALNEVTERARKQKETVRRRAILATRRK